ncbi:MULTISPECIES: helix-turn-helix domain-containing protein [Paenibacillus]|uniref:Helix-turn-helix family protein n=1 Tax=Paenibacillus macerans TaxID=44252 RepID=A0A090Z7M4_PAEMA|nr:helix-turn-helix transcriptional regulator [Paenibacillus macerans]KFN07274.1 helix-turn-helix family protein [Paenibacillus macerans]MCY7558252.1 helix-turn-helix domain-containing protein [Paenibacillus macerans]MEC0154610.1 helix-turn-helix transcriptional regulator [Paenibacillus macerans]SUA85657.1 XRE family transcriptional regulator [Paenibacillus macerans]
METIGQRLRFLRNKHNLTQEKVAEMIGKKKGNISNYESDSYEPSAQTIIAICRLFNVSSDWFLTGEESVSKSEQTSGFDIETSDVDYQLINKIQQLSEKEKLKVEGYIDAILGGSPQHQRVGMSSKLMNGEEAAAKDVG